MRLWVTRPEPDASDQAAALARLGHEATVEPLLTVAFRDGEPLPTHGLQAVLATSRNGLRALARRGELSELRALPLFAVGGATAALGRELGFATVREAEGSGASLARLVAARRDPAAGALLHLAGEDLAFDLRPVLAPLGFELRQPSLYRAVASKRLSDAILEALRGGAIEGVLLMSPRTAEIYSRLIRAHGLEAVARETRHFCLSPAVAERLDFAARRHLAVAARPRQGALLALIGEAAAHCGPASAHGPVRPRPR